MSRERAYHQCIGLNRTDSIPDGLGRHARLAWGAADGDGVRRIAQAAPVLRYHNAVDGTMGIVAHRAGKAQPAVVDVYKLAEIRHILRALIADARDRVFIEDELQAVRTAALVGPEVRNVDNGS